MMLLIVPVWTRTMLVLKMLLTMAAMVMTMIRYNRLSRKHPIIMVTSRVMITTALMTMILMMATTLTLTTTATATMWWMVRSIMGKATIGSKNKTPSIPMWMTIPRMTIVMSTMILLPTLTPRTIKILIFPPIPTTIMWPTRPVLPTITTATTITTWSLTAGIMIGSQTVAAKEDRLVHP